MKNRYLSRSVKSPPGVQAISFLFLLCLLSLNIQSCRQAEQASPIASSRTDGDLTAGISNAADLIAEAFKDAAKNKVLQQAGNSSDALQASMLQTLKRVKGIDYYNKVVDGMKSNKSKPWSIQDENIGQYADRKFAELTKNSKAREAALSQTFKDYLGAIRGALVEGGNQVVNTQSSGTVDSKVVSDDLSQSLNKLDASIRSDFRLSSDEKQVLLASTSLSRTTSGPTTDLIKSMFDSSHGRGWGWFRAICNIVLTIAIIVVVVVALAALAVAIIPAGGIVLAGITIAEGTVVEAIFGGGVGVLVNDIITGSYLCLFPDDGLYCN